MFTPSVFQAERTPPARSAAESPAAWRVSGEGDLAWYDITLDRATVFQGHHSLRISARSSSARYGGVVQRIRADRYRGHHVQVTGHFRIGQAPAGAALVVRAEGEVTQFAFRRILAGNAVTLASSWQEDSVVVAVSPRAVGISIGAFLVGTGVVWLDEFSVRVVPDSVPLSPRHRRIQPLTADSLAHLYRHATLAPRDLGFDSGGIR